MKKTLRLFVVVLAFATLATAARIERQIDGWQPVHFDVKIAFDRGLTKLESATTEITILIRRDELRVIDFDFGTMKIDRVTVDGETARFVSRAGKLDVYLPKIVRKDKEIKVAVSYSGVPEDGLILTKDRDGFPSAVGDNWPDRVHHWIPCFDHPSAKASVRFTFTAPAENVAVANGVEESSREIPGGLKTWVFHEKKPISPYNMVVAVGRFATATLKTKARIPISYYVPQSDRKFAAQGFSPAAPSVLTFEKLVAPYPYEKLALIVGATKFGGMENANTIVFTPNLFKDFLTAKPRSARYDVPRGVEEVIAHEIAHQWFGDSVTEETWADLWLSEGFATYFAGVFVENAEGKAEFRRYMRDKAKSYLVYEKKVRTPIHDTETESLFDLLTPNNYEKGSLVLHALRGLLGDEVFFKGIRDFYRKHENKTASTHDLRESFERTSGRDLKWFFRRWIYEAGHPIYKVAATPKSANSFDVTLRQLQPDNAFLDPVTLELVTRKGSRRVRLTPTGKETTITVKGALPRKINVDPDEFIVKEVVE